MHVNEETHPEPLPANGAARRSLTAAVTATAGDATICNSWTVGRAWAPAPRGEPLAPDRTLAPAGQ